ncbi:MAG: methyltransferase domain-containing protein [Alphaproteobacteria bacterium]|nr:methyltransferase domain-containing protein [Alphaproteobacteria bacterium]
MSVDRGIAAPHCRLCGRPLEQTFADLGETPLANRNLKPGEEACEKRYPLIARVCGTCMLVQVDSSVPPEEIFSDYDYFSSTSTQWVAHARQYAEAMRRRFDLGGASMVVEIASNDGYLLQHFKAAAIPVLGVEPAANVAAKAIAGGIRTEVAFFGVETAERLRKDGFAADLMAANNVLAHVPDVVDFAGGFAVLLKPEGVATFEFPHILRLIEGAQFDTIYHEHFFYLSLLAAERILKAAGLRVFDVEELTSHGGSLRIFVCRENAAHETTSRLEALRALERAAGLDELSGYAGLAPRIERAKASFLDFLARAKAEGKTVAAYGAAAKGNTFLNVCKVRHPDIVAVYDANPSKQNKLTPGSHIPILPPARMLDQRPDFVVILPWNIADEILAVLRPLSDWHGRAVVAIPETRIL